MSLGWRKLSSIVLVLRVIICQICFKPILVSLLLLVLWLTIYVFRIDCQTFNLFKIVWRQEKLYSPYLPKGGVTCSKRSESLCSQNSDQSGSISRTAATCSTGNCSQLGYLLISAAEWCTGVSPTFYYQHLYIWSRAWNLAHNLKRER